MPIVAAADDIDDLNHVSNLVYVRWVLDVAMAHSRSKGWDHPQYRALGAVWVVRRHEIDYVQQVMLGDELVATTWVDLWRAASCVRKTELTRDGQIVARGSTLWALISFETGRPTRITADLKTAFIDGHPK